MYKRLNVASEPGWVVLAEIVNEIRLMKPPSHFVAMMW